jgi:hypothetical protein
LGRAVATDEGSIEGIGEDVHGLFFGLLLLLLLFR